MQLKLRLTKVNDKMRKGATGMATPSLLFFNLKTTMFLSTI